MKAKVFSKSKTSRCIFKCFRKQERQFTIENNLWKILKLQQLVRLQRANTQET